MLHQGRRGAGTLRSINIVAVPKHGVFGFAEAHLAQFGLDFGSVGAVSGQLPRGNCLQVLLVCSNLT